MQNSCQKERKKWSLEHLRQFFRSKSAVSSSSGTVSGRQTNF